MNVDRVIVRVGNQDQNAVYKTFGAVFVASGTAGQSKTVVFPDGYNNDGNLAFKVVFPNGHNDGTNLDALTLNGIAVVVNQNGSLVPIPHHAMTESNATVYKVLQPNTVLELYYTADYDGNNTPAFVVIGNPVVLSSADYTIYANGQIDNKELMTNLGLSYLNVQYANASTTEFSVSHTIQNLPAGRYALYFVMSNSESVQCKIFDHTDGCGYWEFFWSRTNPKFINVLYHNGGTFSKTTNFSSNVASSIKVELVLIRVG